MVQATIDVKLQEAVIAARLLVDKGSWQSRPSRVAKTILSPNFQGASVKFLDSKSQDDMHESA